MTNYSFIGRPPDPENDKYICPRCSHRSLRKSGLHKNPKNNQVKQLYFCKDCHFTTTKPIEQK